MKKGIFRYLLRFACLFGVLTVINAFLGLRLLDVIFYIHAGVFTLLFLASFIALFRIMRLISVKSPKWPALRTRFFLFFSFFVFFIIHSIATNSIIHYKAREEILRYLANIDMASTILKINGVAINNKEPFISSLRQLHSHIGWRSRKINEVTCEIDYHGDVITLLIAQNGNIRDQYWVCYPKYHATEGNSIGCFYFQKNLIYLHYD